MNTAISPTLAAACERYLGPGIDPGDPRRLLGILADVPTRAEIITALQQRLGVLSTHPGGTEPAANELRFALHAAAARLIEQGEASSPVPTLGDSSQDAAMRGLATQLLLHGGWTPTVMEEAAKLARGQGRAVAEFTGSASGARMALPVPGQGSPIATGVSFPQRRSMIMEPEAEPSGGADPARKFIIVGAWFVGGVMTLLMALIAVVVVASRIVPSAPTGSGPVASSEPAADGSDSRRSSGSAVREPVSELPKASDSRTGSSAPSTGTMSGKPLVNRVEEWADLVREAEACVSMLRGGDVGGVERLDSVASRMAAHWTSATFDGRSAAINALIEAVYAARDHPELCLQLVRKIARFDATAPLAADEVWPGVWAAGVLARLSSERDLPRIVVRAIDEFAADAFPDGAAPESSFESGAAAALATIAGMLVAGVPAGSDAAVAAASEGWKRWVEASAALRGRESVLNQQLLLGALDHLLGATPEPSINQSVFDGITILTAALSWRENDASRRWLLRAFDSKAVSTADLFAVTSAIATRSGAPGVDQTMVLHPTAQESARAALRDQFASVWGLGDTEKRDESWARWAAASREFLRAEASSVPLAALVRAVVAARLNAAAWLLWSGAADRAASVLSDQDSGLTKRLEMQVGGRELQPIPRGLSAWALQYLPMQQAGGRIADRRKMLQEFAGPPNGADAKIIVDDACYAGNDGLRADAQNTLKRFASDASVLNALLAASPSMPATNSCSLLVAEITGVTLPPVKQEGWRVAVRRALVERLLEVVAGKADRGITDDAGEMLAEAYGMRQSGPVIGSATGTADLPRNNTLIEKSIPSPEAAGSTHRAAWLREAEGMVPSGREPVSLSRAAAARAARARMAQGRVQLFAAAQADIADLMSFVIVAERGNRAEAARGILADLAAERRGALHIYHQIESAERAMLRLWLLRLGETETGGDS